MPNTRQGRCGLGNSSGETHEVALQRGGVYIASSVSATDSVSPVRLWLRTSLALLVLALNFRRGADSDFVVTLRHFQTLVPHE